MMPGKVLPAKCDGVTERRGEWWLGGNFLFSLLIDSQIRPDQINHKLSQDNKVPGNLSQTFHQTA